jgi:twinkle protein
MLVKHGAEDLCWYIDNAKVFPIEGIIDVADIEEAIDRLHENGFTPGLSTGWRMIDQLYTVRPAEFTAVTGIPSSGKSTWIDNLMINMARLHGWIFAIFSPENLPIEDHVSSMIEKYMRKPFNRGPTERLSSAEMRTGRNWINEHFHWIMPSDEENWTVEEILLAAKKLCLRHGIRGLVIDPWNELESLRPPGLSETEYISRCLKKIRMFAKRHGVHVWVVIHPTKLYRSKENGEYPVPSLYDCAGSAHWRNKSDNGIVIWRQLNDSERKDFPEVEIHVEKIRFRQVGRRGIAKLYYDPICATYFEFLS